MGIISNSYPFISLEEMKEKLIKAGVLTTVKVGDIEIVTAKNNEDIIENYDPTRLDDIKDITMDEFVSGLQNGYLSLY